MKSITPQPNHVLIIDNHDSFVYNLAHYIEMNNFIPIVKRPDLIDLNSIANYSHILISPGPGLPKETPLLAEIIKKYGPSKNILGVCLGHQAIAEVLGANLYNLKKVYHGVSSRIKRTNTSDALLNRLPTEFDVARYHSWAVKDLPDCLTPTSYDEEGCLMSYEHKELKLFGVQFHPESILTPLGMTILKNWLTI
ncbi:aminodeoxychorismate/anthranilate synthase component II [Mesonia sp. HuA40]|uniref:anthranilate synthase component II n=1 Tax=Mesonia sp. HuA40 TaxID=2602761 RepID=UPI0011C86896|nr:aminodeoxychorismate/anthranilate synthase component II [Mesonia sp. HuA40]TXK73618.1 aminodeoxychorismate/anthranilate synthase component II [Mesonia sp. HuA40]